MTALPTIVHLDADAFFVACEQARDPSLRGKKCAVGGRERGIISSASYEARACGVYTPMPTSRALRVCPDLILIKHTSGLYGEVSRRMFDLCERLTPIVQRNSIDEGYLDLAPCGLGSTEALVEKARGLQASLRDELGLSVSFGLAANKLVAQIASKLRKPGGFVVVEPGQEASFLAPLPVGKLPGIGAKTEAAFAEKGIRRVSDLVMLSERDLKALAGNGWEDLRASALGVDSRPVETDSDDAKSYSQQETFAKDIVDVAVIERVSKGMLDELMAKVRADGKTVRTVTVKVRYPDFSDASRAHSLPEATDLGEAFYPVIGRLIREAWTRRRPLRLVSVRVSGVEAKGAQLELFTEGDAKRRALAAVIDRLNAGKPRAAVQKGHQLGTQTEGER